MTSPGAECAPAKAGAQTGSPPSRGHNARFPSAKLLLPLLSLSLAACAVGDRGMESVHQPVVAEDHAFVPNCPYWDDSTGGERESLSSNFGCATNANLAAMIANPQDLLHGRSDGLDTEISLRAVKAWREAAPTSKQWTVSVVGTGATGGK